VQIGNLKIDSNAILAPMAEITDFAFRKIAKEYGAGLTYTQMVSAEGIAKGDFNTLRLLTFSKNEFPVGVQLLGNDVGILGAAVRELTKLNISIIDLNCGCPVEKVVKNKMGSYLLTQPKLLGKLVKSMVENSNGIPISIKIRLGFRDEINVLETAKIIEDNGASAILLHARTRNGKYNVEPDLEWIAKVKEISELKIIGNGSIFTVDDAVNMIKKTNCDGVLMARGALGNPFIFKQFNLLKKGISYKPEYEEIFNVVLQHIELLEREQGFTKNFDRAKKNIIWYYKNYNGIWCLIEQLLSASNFAEIKKIVINHSEKLQSGKYPEEDFEIVNKKFKDKVLFWLAKEEKGKVCYN
jgi:tRNA-dihydrouridine synthase B